MSVKKLSPDWLNPSATAQSIADISKQKFPSLYKYANEATQSGIIALMKFGIGYICDYGDVNYVFRIQVDENKNVTACIEYTEDEEGTRRLECQGLEAQLLTTAFAPTHPNACFMYARKQNPNTPFPILLYETNDPNVCAHLSANSMKIFREKNIKNFSVACKIPTLDAQQKQIK